MAQKGKKSDQTPQPPKRNWRFVALNSALPGVSDPLFKKRGFAKGEIIRRWADIVGPELSQLCQPISLKYGRGASLEGTLTVKASGAAATLITHESDQILNRINSYYGYRAVGKLKIQQGRPQGASGLENDRTKQAQDLNPEAESNLSGQVEGIQSPELRKALMGWGREILVDKSQKES